MSNSVCDDLRAYLDASPTARHAAQSSVEILKAAGFTERTDSHRVDDTKKYFVQWGNVLVAWRSPESQSAETQFVVVGAHLDSPGLRIKPQPITIDAGLTRLGVEVYGGPLLNSWLDRDLGLAGAILVNDEFGPREVLVCDSTPSFRIPQLAIHLDRPLDDAGRKLDRQRHLPLLWTVEQLGPDAFREYLGALAGVSGSDVIAWDLVPFDVTPAALSGRNGEFLASARLDDLVGCFGALHALISAPSPQTIIPVVVLVDHEEVGSVSEVGAQSARVRAVLESISDDLGATRRDFLESLGRSHGVSVDMAHATHPGYPERHDPEHPIRMNAGPVIKHNAQQRYATSLSSMAPFLRACAAAEVAVQQFVSHSEMPCGSTIGPAISSTLGIPVVDVGIAQLAMHSVREVCGSEDPAKLIRVLSQFFTHQ